MMNEIVEVKFTNLKSFNIHSTRAGEKKCAKFKVSAKIDNRSCLIVDETRFRVLTEMGKQSAQWKTTVIDVLFCSSERLKIILF